MNSPPIVEQLDILKDLRPCLIPRVVIAMVVQLVLQRAVETLHHGVVVAGPLLIFVLRDQAVDRAVSLVLFDQFVDLRQILGKR